MTTNFRTLLLLGLTGLVGSLSGCILETTTRARDRDMDRGRAAALPTSTSTSYGKWTTAGHRASVRIGPAVARRADRRYGRYV